MSLRQPGLGQCREGPQCTRPSAHTAISASLRARGQQQRPHRTLRLRGQRMSSRDAEKKLQPGGSKAKVPPLGCHLSVCSLKLAIIYPLSCLSICLPTRIQPHIHPFICLPVCWSSIHLSLHQPTSFLPSTHPSVCIFPSIHFISQPSTHKPAHTPSHHSPTSLSVQPHACANPLPALQSTCPSLQPSIHLSVQPAIRHVDDQEDKQSGHNSSTSPGEAETWTPTRWTPKPAPPLGSRVMWDALLSSGSQSPVCTWKARGRDACPADTSQHAQAVGGSRRASCVVATMGCTSWAEPPLASPMGQGPTLGGSHHPRAPGPRASGNRQARFQACCIPGTGGRPPPPPRPPPPSTVQARADPSDPVAPGGTRGSQLPCRLVASLLR